MAPFGPTGTLLWRVYLVPHLRDEVAGVHGPRRSPFHGAAGLPEHSTWFPPSLYSFLWLLPGFETSIETSFETWLGGGKGGARRIGPSHLLLSTVFFVMVLLTCTLVFGSFSATGNEIFHSQVFHTLMSDSLLSVGSAVLSVGSYFLWSCVDL